MSDVRDVKEIAREITLPCLVHAVEADHPECGRCLLITRVAAALTAEREARLAAERDAKEGADLFVLKLNQLIAARRRIAALEAALRRAHDCATLRDDGMCDGCYVSDLLASTAPPSANEAGS